jgi:hypothetical protein
MMIDKEFIALRDLKDAFRQLKLNAAEWKYCGYSLFGQFWVDSRVAYGLSSSAASCQRFVELICAIFNKVALRRRYGQPGARDVRHCYDQILAYIDDFLLAARSLKDCAEMERRFDELLRRLGVRQSASKAVSACVRAVVYGWEWDLSASPKTISIPMPKLIETRKGIIQALKHRLVTVRALKKLNGKIMHYSQVKREAKVFIWNSTHAVAEFCKSKRVRNNYVVLLPPQLVRCWAWWLEHSHIFATAPISSLLTMPATSITAVTDASSRGGGYFIGDNWASYEFRDDMSELPIAAKEAHVILTMIHTLAESLQGRRLCVYCDNANVVGAVIRRWSSSAMLMTFVGELVMALLKFRIALRIDWISTHENIFADALSRFRIKEFKGLCQARKMTYNQQRDAIVYPSNYQFPGVTTASDAAEYQAFEKWALTKNSRRRKRWWCDTPKLNDAFRSVV